MTLPARIFVEAREVCADANVAIRSGHNHHARVIVSSFVNAFDNPA